jgi:hypothetical protein
VNIAFSCLLWAVPALSAPVIRRLALRLAQAAGTGLDGDWNGLDWRG